MKKLFLIALFFSLLNVKAQDNNQQASPEKNISGVQTGIFGIWGYNEFRLNNKFVLHSELGFDFNYANGTGYPKPLFIVSPKIRVSPRFYYNFSQRLEKGKNISKNSGNFFSLPVDYIPSPVVYSNYKDVSITPMLLIVPTWGIRRNYNQWDFEAGIGLGGIYYFVPRNNFGIKPYWEKTLNLHLRFGYSF